MIDFLYFDKIQAESSLFIVILAALGLAFGSFLNVVISRLPIVIGLKDKPKFAGDSYFNLAYPASCCPSCGHKIRAWENIPLLSYILLRGKCSACLSSISFRYFFVELITPVMIVICWVKFGWSPVDFLFAFTICTLLLLLAVIDMETMFLPDVLVFSLWLLGMGLAMNRNGMSGLITSGIHSTMAALLLFGFTELAMIFIRKKKKLSKEDEGMGLGDIKFFGALVACFGYLSAYFILVCSSVLFIAFSILFSKNESEEKKPFGHCLALSGVILLFS